jgi:hypothetical protein
MVPDELPALHVEEVGGDENGRVDTTHGRWFEEANAPSQAGEQTLSGRLRHRRALQAAVALTVTVLILAGSCYAFLLPTTDEPASVVATEPPVPTIPPDSKVEVPPTNAAITTTEPAAEIKPTPVDTPPRATKAEPRREVVRVTTVPVPEPTRVDPVEEPEHATFRATGTADRVRLRGRSGTHGPGEVPPGTYTLEASFDGGASFVDFGFFTVASGGTLTVVCNRDFGNCRKVE